MPQERQPQDGASSADRSHTIGIDARKVEDFGIGTYIRQLVRGLAEIDERNRYILFVGPKGRNALADLPENFILQTTRSPVYSVRELYAMSWHILRTRLDLFHATHYVLPAWSPCRTIVTIHDIIHLLFPEFLPNRLAYFYARRMIRRSLMGSDHVITVSRSTRSDLLEHFAVEGKKLQVIYNGVNDVYREKLSTEELARWQERLGIRSPYFLFVGNPKPHKNLDRVVQAYARACELIDCNASLVCVGAKDGAEFKTRQRAEQLGVADRVQFLGHVDQEALPAIYQGASIFLYPTLYEGFGLPVVEAMASGTAVITSRNSALREVAEGYAHLVDPLDIEEMADAIVHCFRDQDHRASLARLGMRRAKDFDWKVTAQETLASYRAILEAGSS